MAKRSLDMYAPDPNILADIIPAAMYGALLAGLTTGALWWDMESGSVWSAMSLAAIVTADIISLAKYAVAVAVELLDAPEEELAPPEPVQAATTRLTPVQANGKPAEPLRLVDMPPLRLPNGMVVPGTAVAVLSERERVGEKLVRDNNWLDGKYLPSLSTHYRTLIQQLKQIGYLSETQIVLRPIRECYGYEDL